MQSALSRRAWLALLLVEFLDELLYGLREAAWPLLRQDLALSYAQLGILLSVPNLVGNLVEPALGLLADTRWRGLLWRGGGLVFALAAATVGLAPSFVWLLLALSLLSPASGVFVGLSQASLAEHSESREGEMARWVLAGSLGVFLAPLLLGGLYWFGASWRAGFVACGVLAAVLALANRSPARAESDEESASWRGLWRLLRTGGALRWVLLLELADLAQDILFGFLALYFVEVAGLSLAASGLAVALWTGAGFLGDALAVPLFARFGGARVVRAGAAFAILFLVGLLLWPGLWWLWSPLLGASTLGWYALLQARLYDSLPGRSGAALALTNVFNFGGALVPLGMGLLADRVGLWPVLWLLLLGPLSVLLFGPSPERSSDTK
jgi:FSR family fosmidomycin resistance protein-like MFS transporter